MWDSMKRIFLLLIIYSFCSITISAQEINKKSDIDSTTNLVSISTTHPRIIRMSDVSPTESRLLPELYGNKKFTGGGIYHFEPGETAHPEEHRHDKDEIFIVTQGKGFLPINGVDTFNIQTGDIVIIRAGEDHHCTSSIEAPLTTVYFWVEK